MDITTRLLLLSRQSLPPSGLLFDIPNRYPFVDRVGANTRTLYGLQYLHLAGATDFTNASIIGTETVTSKPAGTAPITVAAGKLTIGAGDLWSLVMSNGSTYEFGTILTATTGVVFDTSGNGRHLLFTVEDTSVVCISGSRENGSDVFDTEGSELYENLLSGHPIIKTGMYCSAIDSEGFYSSTKTVSSTSSAFLIFPTNGFGKYAKNTSRYLSIALRKLSSSTVNQVEFGWSAPFSGHSAEKISGPGTLVMWSGLARVTGLSETEDTVILLTKNDFTVGSDVGSRFTIWPGSSTINTVGAGCKFRNIHIGDGLTPRSYTHRFNTPYLQTPIINDKNISNFGKIVVIGDSIAYYMAPYIGDIAKYSTVVNKGVGGHKTSSVLGRFNADVIAENANACILICGINDTLTGVPIETSKSNYEQCIDFAESNGIEVITATLPPIYNNASWTAEIQTWIDDFNSWVKPLGHPCVDLYAIWGTGNNYFNALYNLDNLHPNTNGRIEGAYAFELAIQTTARHQALRLALKVVDSAKQNITRTSGTGTNLEDDGLYTLPDSHTFRTAVGWTYGVDHWAFTSTGIPKVIPGSTLIANGGGDQFFCGSKRIAGYSTVQVEPALTKIKRMTGD